MFHQTSSKAFHPAEAVTARPVISVLGLGRAGVATAAALATFGYQVIGMDADDEKVEALKFGRLDDVEPGLAGLLDRGIDTARISATDDILLGILASDITFICEGCGVDFSGQPDSYALAAMGQMIGKALSHKDGFHVIVQRAPVPLGTIRNILIPAIERASGRIAGRDFGICHVPASLTDDRAAGDLLGHGKCLLGVNDRRSADQVENVLAHLNLKPLVTSIEVAELASSAPSKPDAERCAVPSSTAGRRAPEGQRPRYLAALQEAF